MPSTTTTARPLDRDARIAATLARRAADQAARIPARDLAPGTAILLPMDLPGERFFAAGHPAIVVGSEAGRGGGLALTVAVDYGRMRTMLLAPGSPVRLG